MSSATMQYWLFQANPQFFQLKEALRAGVVTSFIVKQHKDKIKPQDKIILWQTGKHAGIYALATVISEVQEKMPATSEAVFYPQQISSPNLRVQIQIDYNLWNKVITKELIPNHPEFDRFYAGLPHTNYKASEAQYNAIIQLIEQYDLINEPVEEYIVQKTAHYPLNLILHGPPGTGKTYHTINYALAIIENRSLEELRLENRKELRQRFEKYTSKGWIDFVTFHQSMSYEDFVEGIKPQVAAQQITYEVADGIFKKICLKAKQSLVENFNKNFPKEASTQTNEDDINIPTYAQLGAQKHVLIIDEINRGNIAAIFGELITLIEPDKREGQKESLRTILPYSKKWFAVPTNIHLLCTMNTADRSIDTMDMALRRRFTFVEMLPNPTVLKQSRLQAIHVGVELDRMLTAINTRLAHLLDKSHCIGHAFLMHVYTLDDLREAFATKVIPLLKEYFYGDYAKIGLILGSNFLVETSPEQDDLFADFDYEYLHEIQAQKTYNLRPIEMLHEIDFIRIYDKSYTK